MGLTRGAPPHCPLTAITALLPSKHHSTGERGRQWRDGGPMPPQRGAKASHGTAGAFNFQAEGRDPAQDQCLTPCDTEIRLVWADCVSRHSLSVTSEARARQRPLATMTSV